MTTASSPDRPLAVLLIGATGYIGRVVAESLHAHGHRVIALLRPGAASVGLPPDSVVRRGDLADPASLGAAITDNVDAVVNLATPSGSEDVDSAATTAILGSLRGTGRAYLYTSGVWVLGPTGDDTLDETADTHPIELVAYRPRIEQQVLEAAAFGVRSAVLRPGIVHGRGGGIPALLVQLAEEHGAVRLLGEPPVHWPMVHVGDLADLFIRALGHAQAGAVLHGVAEQAVDAWALSKAAGAVAGVTRERTWPLAEARLTLGAGFADALACDQSVSADHTKRALGWSPEHLGGIEDLTAGSYGSNARVG